MDHHFPHLELHLPFAEFERLPQNSAYKYEYFGGRAVLSPPPKCPHAVLDLAPREPDPGLELRPLPPGEILSLAPLFRSAFHRVQPFASLDDAGALAVARDCLEKTASGGDGPLIE